jgi:hypothetical protein
MRERLGPDVVISFFVDRVDGFHYITPDIERVVQEENEEWRRLIRLKISTDSPVECVLDFSDVAHLSVEGADADKVYLLASTIREYVQSEVTVIKTPSWVVEFGGFAAAIPFFIGLLLLVAFDAPDEAWSAAAKAARDGSDVAAKLNVLLDRAMAGRQLKPYAPVALTLFGVSIALFAVLQQGKVLAHLFPRNEFMWGKRKKRIDDRLALRSKIFWAIGISLAVGLVGRVIWLFIERWSG